MGSAAARLSFGGKFCLFPSNCYTVVAAAIAKKHGKTSNMTKFHVDRSEVPTASRSWDR
jgi:hypothetical protein